LIEPRFTGHNPSTISLTREKKLLAARIPLLVPRIRSKGGAATIGSSVTASDRVHTRRLPNSKRLTDPLVYNVCLTCRGLGHTT